MKRLTAALVLTAVVLLTIGCDRGDKTVLLRYKYRPGTTTVYESTYKGNTRIRLKDSLVVDRANDIVSSTNGYVRKMIDDSTAEMLETRSYHYRFTDKLSGEITDTVVTKEAILIRLTKRGKLVGVEHQKSNVLANAGKADLSYEQGLPVFPVSVVKQGMEWTHETNLVEGDQLLSATTTYRIEAFVRERGFDCVTISYRGSTVIPFADDSPDNLSRTGENKLTVKGLMYFSYADGLVISQRERRTIDGRGVQGVAGDGAAEVTISVAYDIDLVLVQPPTLLADSGE